MPSKFGCSRSTSALALLSILSVAAARPLLRRGPTFAVVNVDGSDSTSTQSNIAPATQTVTDTTTAVSTAVSLAVSTETSITISTATATSTLIQPAPSAESSIALDGIPIISQDSPATPTLTITVSASVLSVAPLSPVQPVVPAAPTVPASGVAVVDQGRSSENGEILGTLQDGVSVTILPSATQIPSPAATSSSVVDGVSVDDEDLPTETALDAYASQSQSTIASSVNVMTPTISSGLSMTTWATSVVSPIMIATSGATSNNFTVSAILIASSNDTMSQTSNVALTLPATMSTLIISPSSASSRANPSQPYAAKGTVISTSQSASSPSFSSSVVQTGAGSPSVSALLASTTAIAPTNATATISTGSLSTVNTPVVATVSTSAATSPSTISLLRATSSPVAGTPTASSDNTSSKATIASTVSYSTVVVSPVPAVNPVQILGPVVAGIALPSFTASGFTTSVIVATTTVQSSGGGGGLPLMTAFPIPTVSATQIISRA